MPILVAYALAVVFSAIAAVHFYWVVVGVGAGGVAVPMRSNGVALFLPSRFTTSLVVLALVAAVFVVLGRVSLLPSNSVPPIMFRIGAWILGCVFLARSIGEFHYVGLFKTERSTAFAKADTRYFTPLCILIAGGVFYLALQPLA